MAFPPARGTSRDAPSRNRADSNAKPDLHNALANIRYEARYQNMRSGVRQAVGQIAVGVDGTIDAPLVTGTVETARHVAGDVQEVASATWMQLRPRR